MNRFWKAPLWALGILGVIVCAVSWTGGLPEPFATRIGQNISRGVHTAFLIVGIGALAFGPLGAGETRMSRVILLLGALFGYAVLVLGLKELIYLPRPGEPAVWTSGARGSGFPSGHTVPAWEVACLLAALYPRFAVAALAMAVSIGYARVEVMAHYAYQVAISAAMGAALGVALGRWHRARVRGRLATER